MISIRNKHVGIYTPFLRFSKRMVQGHRKWVVLISSWVVRLPVTLFCWGIHVGGFVLPTKSTEKS